MRFLSLTDVVAISDPERERLREADDAIRDIVTLVSEQTAEARLNAELVSTAMIDILLLAAARLALAAQPKSEAAQLSGEFSELAQQALDWARARAEPGGAREIR